MGQNVSDSCKDRYIIPEPFSGKQLQRKIVRGLSGYGLIIYGNQSMYEIMFSLVCFSHGRGNIFSCRGIKLVVEFFLKRGYQQNKITVVVPGWRLKAPRKHQHISDQCILAELKRDGILHCPPPHSYDDRFDVYLVNRSF